MKGGLTLCWLLLMGVLALTSAQQCHNLPCQQTNFKEYSACLQGSCTNNCQCHTVACNTCAMSEPCCQHCCQSQPSTCSSCQANNNCQCNSVTCNTCAMSEPCCQQCCQPQPSTCSSCQGSNCPSNCPTGCPSAPRPRTCADFNCRTCRGEECKGCCDVRTTTRQSGQPVTQPTPIRACNVTNIIKPNVTMPNITITINQPPIHITTGPVLNKISAPCPHPGHVSCPSPKTNTNCCRVQSTRCLPTSNPMRPYCYNYYQPTCGPRCEYQQPPQQYYPLYIPQPQPQPQPMYIPQYIPVPQPQPTPCPESGCPVAQQPQYAQIPCVGPGCYGVETAASSYIPYPTTGQTGCVGQWPYIQCPSNTATDGIAVAALDGAAPLPYQLLPPSYNTLPAVINDPLQQGSVLGLRSGDGNNTRFVVVKNNTDDNEEEEDEEEEEEETKQSN